MRAEFAEDSNDGILCQAACKASPACCEDPELAAQAIESLAGHAKDSDCHVRVAACDVLLACSKGGGPNPPRGPCSCWLAKFAVDSDWTVRNPAGL